MTFKSNDEFSDRVRQAIEFATKAHSGQERRGGKPYVTHPITVLKIVAHLTSDEDILCAAVLHDVLEDTDVTYDELASEFGEIVANYVQEVTEDEKKNFSIHTVGAAMIKAADTLHNLSDDPTEKQAQKYFNILNRI